MILSKILKLANRLCLQTFLRVFQEATDFIKKKWNGFDRRLKEIMALLDLLMLITYSMEGILG